jgi:hypothetical protein
MVSDENTERNIQAAALAGEDPIIVTGGSVILEYPDDTDNTFVDDGYGHGKKGKMKKLKNKSKGKDDAELTFVRVFDKSGALLKEIDLKALGKKNKDLRIEICYAAP